MVTIDNLIGYDASHWNVFDMKLLASETLYFIGKCTQGVKFVDPTYADRIKIVEDSLECLGGGYHFGNNEPVKEQVNNFVQHVGLNRLWGLDLEIYDPSQMTLDQAADFVQQIYDLTGGMWIVLYTSSTVIGALYEACIKAHGGNKASAVAALMILKNCPLWIADPNTPPTIPRDIENQKDVLWSDWKLNQFTTNRADGISTKLDENRFNGDLAALHVFWKAQSPTQLHTPVNQPITNPAAGQAHIETNGGILRLRDIPGLIATQVIYKIPNGSNVTVLSNPPETRDNYVWWKLEINLALQGWAASNFIKPGKAPISPLPPVTSVAGGWGLHGLEKGSIPDEPYPIYLSVDNVSFLKLAQIKNPKATLVFRDYAYHERETDTYINESGGAAKAVDRWWNDLAPIITQLPKGTFIVSFNEKGASSLYFQFEGLRAAKLKSEGYRAVCGGLAVASYESELWTRCAESVRQIAANGGALGIHCYAQTILSANYGDSYWDANGSWHGALFPSLSDPKDALTALRVLRDQRDLKALGIDIQIIATELGLDDLGGAVYYPAGGKTRGWQSCTSIWQTQGWLKNMDAVAFYRMQLDWWAKTTGMLGCVFTDGTANDSRWDSYNVESWL